MVLTPRFPMSAVATRSYTVEEYLELDAEADDERYELQNGSVIPDKPLLAQYTRDAEGWECRAHTGRSDTVASKTFGLEVPLRDLYALVMREE